MSGAAGGIGNAIAREFASLGASVFACDLRQDAVAAHELGPYGIRVNSVVPGLMLTNEATRRQWAAYGADRQRALVEGIALRRLGSARDVFNAVVFLASDLSAFITGQHLQVDGGR
ncbi:MAG TPA: SDR family oxidoreductase [Steroidobacteraceae bacterium]|nr:SDR family oxidoreductase [Steroidobacteraceae bacterium]